MEKCGCSGSEAGEETLRRTAYSAGSLAAWQAYFDTIKERPATSDSSALEPVPAIGRATAPSYGAALVRAPWNARWFAHERAILKAGKSGKLKQGFSSSR